MNVKNMKWRKLLILINQQVVYVDCYKVQVFCSHSFLVPYTELSILRNSNNVVRTGGVPSSTKDMEQKQKSTMCHLQNNKKKIRNLFYVFIWAHVSCSFPSNHEKQHCVSLWEISKIKEGISELKENSWSWKSMSDYWFSKMEKMVQDRIEYLRHE